MILLDEYRPLAASPKLRGIVSKRETSPLKNRVGGFAPRPSGRMSRPRPQTPAIMPGCKPFGYKTASGRARWLSRDPIGESGGVNLYGYVANNPVNLIDPDGLTPMSAWGAKVAITGGIGVGNKLGFGAKALGSAFGLNEVPDDYEAHKDTSRKMCKYGDKGVAEFLGNLAESGPYYKEGDSELDQQANAEGREQGNSERPPWVDMFYWVIYWSPF